MAVCKFLLQVLAILVFATTVQAQVRTTPQTAALLGASKADPTSTSYGLIFIIDSFDLSNQKAFLCSGTLVGPRTVLTAAHCIHKEYGIPGHLVLIGGNWYEATAAEIHPQFVLDDLNSPDPEKFFLHLYTDIAVIVLDSDVVGVRPTPIMIDETVSTGDLLSVSGFGTNELSSVKDGLQEIVSGFRSTSIKVDGADKYAFFSRYSTQQKAVCEGDSGGGLIKRIGGYRGVVGVTSETNATTINASGQCEPRGGSPNADFSLFPIPGSSIGREFLSQFDGIQYISGRLAHFAAGLPKLDSTAKSAYKAKSLTALKSNARRVLSTVNSISRFADSKRKGVVKKIKSAAVTALNARSVAAAQKALKVVPTACSTLKKLGVS